jgi:integrase/recombinase XerD
MAKHQPVRTTTKTKPKVPGCFWRGKTLWARIRKGGRHERFSLHTSDPATALKLREERAKEIDGEIYHGIEPSKTVDAIVEEWAPHAKRNLGAKTIQRYRVSLDQIWPYVTGRSLSEINGRLIAHIIEKRMEVGVANATIKRDLGALSQVFNFAIAQGYIETNPVLPRMRGVKEKRDPIILPDLAHIEMVRRRCPPGLARLVDAALRTGCRQDELVQTVWSNVDHARKQLTIVGKGRKLRTIDLEPFGAYGAVFSDLDAIGQRPIFSHGDGTQRYRSVAVRFHEIVASVEKHAKEAGIEFRPFRFHDLRHRHAVDWLKSGKSIYDLQRRLGHSSVKTTEIYLAYLTGDEAKIAMYGT